MTLQDTSFSPVALDVWPLRAAIQKPRRNAFGTMTSRPALFLRLRLADGSEGWGEVFANWPAFGLHHRVRILQEILAHLIVGKAFSSPGEMARTLEAETHLLMLQCGEAGPFAQCIAGLDIAAWDAVSRRENTPLWRALGGVDGATIHAYASGITADTVDTLVPPLRDSGWSAFKLKVGFGEKTDRNALERLRRLCGPDAILMVDANQVWTPEEAHANIRWLSDHRLAWIEEPMTADAPRDAWAALSRASPIPIAAGENLRGTTAFVDALNDGGISVAQPDPIKWGGLTKCKAVADHVRSCGKIFAPHYLGGAAGLAATQALALAVGAGFMEMDVSENPLRADITMGASDPVDGYIAGSDQPGSGPAPSLAVLEKFAA